MIDFVRTPDDRFEGLSDFPYAPNYLEVPPGLRMHYVDEGDPSAPVALLLHGEPSWSYLYRKMIPILVNNGFRTVAPDLIGFGRSDKPVDTSAYTYASHLDWLRSFIHQMDLQNVFLFAQDWGGLLGLRLATEMEERINIILASNTTLPTGRVPLPESFLKWRSYSKASESFDIGKVIDMGTIKDLSEDVKKAYNAPFPSEEYKAGARMFPSLVPDGENDPEGLENVQIWRKYKNWNKPFYTGFGEGDPIMLGAERLLQEWIPGARGKEHRIYRAGHYIQEEVGEDLAQWMVEIHRSHSS